MTITVTQEDIDKGKRQDCEHCAVALAVNRSFSIHNAHVGGWIITDWKTWNSPECVRKFIEAIDRSRPVQPFTFELA